MNDKEVLQWCEKTVSLLKDGGIWGIPRSNMVLKIDKSKKVFKIVSGYSEQEINVFNHWFGKIGYKIENE